MRIISGEKRGLKLKEVPSEALFRPTLDRVKESMFDIIRFSLEGKALDLFSGTGQLGIEALSNGCEQVVFCDKDPEALKLTRENVKKAGYESRAEILDCDYKHFLKKRAKKAEFNVIFLDPPYESPLIEKSLGYISESDCLAADGTVLVETLKTKLLPDESGNLVKSKSYYYGQVALHVYKKREEKL